MVLFARKTGGTDSFPCEGRWHSFKARVRRRVVPLHGPADVVGGIWSGQLLLWTLWTHFPMQF